MVEGRENRKERRTQRGRSVGREGGVEEMEGRVGGHQFSLGALFEKLRSEASCMTGRVKEESIEIDRHRINRP